MLGAAEVDRVYCGSVLVWERNSSPIPEGYTQLNYIESYGEQWIAPQMNVPDLDDVVRIQTKFAFTYIGSEWQSVVSVNNNDGGSESLYNTYCLYFGYNGSGGITVKNSYPAGSDSIDASPEISLSVGTDYEADIILGADSTSVVVDGNSFTSTINRGIEHALMLFADRPANNWLYQEFAYAKIYYCRIYVNGALAHELLPCIRDIDSVIGMYDTVAREFLTNGGTGSFTGG